MLQKTKLENAKVTATFEMLTNVKNTFDSGRIFFAVANIFEELAM